MNTNIVASRLLFGSVSKSPSYHSVHPSSLPRFFFTNFESTGSPFVPSSTLSIHPTSSGALLYSKINPRLFTKPLTATTAFFTLQKEQRRCMASVPRGRAPPPSKPRQQQPQEEAVESPEVVFPSSAKPEGGVGEKKEEAFFDVTYNNFDIQVFRSPKPVILLCLSARASAQSQQLEEFVSKVYHQSGGGFRVARLDVDRLPDLAQQLQLQMVPTMLFISKGNVIATSENGNIQEFFGIVYMEIAVASGEQALLNAEKILEEGKLTDATKLYSDLSSTHPSKLIKAAAISGLGNFLFLFLLLSCEHCSLCSSPLFSFFLKPTLTSLLISPLLMSLSQPAVQ
jgi:hypothetical protein